MNIVFVSTYLVECGIATYTRALAKHLTLGGHQVSILAEIKDKHPMQEKDGTIPIYRLWHRGMHHNAMFGLGSIIRAIESSPNKPDVVHIQHEFGLFDTKSFFSMLEKLVSLNINVVVTLHTVESGLKRIDFFKKLNPKVQWIVHTDEGAALLPVFSQVIPHGCYVENYDVSSKNSILVPGFMSPTKGVLEIIKAVAELKAKSDLNPEFRLLGLCRSDIYRGKITQALESYGLVDDTVFNPNFLSDEELLKQYKAAGVIVLGAQNSTPYSASGQLHGAMSCGVPVIAKNVPIYRSGGDCGIVYYSNYEECAQFLKNILTNNKLREKLAYKQLAEAEYRNWSDVAEHHIEVYQSLW